MSVWDGFIAGVILFIFVTAGVVIATATVATTNAVNAGNIFTGQGRANYNYVIGFIPQMDYVFVFIYLGMNLAVLVRASFLKTEWSDYVLAWIASFIIIYVSFYISNVFVSVFQSPALASGVGWFRQSIYVIRQLPVYNAIFLGLYSIVLLLAYRGNIELPLRNYVPGMAVTT